MNDLRVFDAHADTVSFLHRYGYDIRRSPGHWDLTRAGAFAGFAQIFALWSDSPGDALWRECQAQHETFLLLLERCPGQLRHCRTAPDVERAWAEGKTAAILSVEGAEMLECDIRKLDIAADWGARALNLTWNFANPLSGSSAERPEQGLTAHGRDFLRAMEERGILPDVSHLSDPGTWDVLRMARGPVIASHSNARALCPHRRNLTDDQFRAIRDTGGFVGLNAYLPFVGGRRRAGGPGSALGALPLPGRGEDRGPRRGLGRLRRFPPGHHRHREPARLPGLPAPSGLAGGPAS